MCFHPHISTWQPGEEVVVLLSLSDIDRLSLMREGKILLMRRDETEMTACYHS
jgi:hypothetical protein